MITDPRTIPRRPEGGASTPSSVGLLACLLIAPWTTEFAAKLAVLGSLTLVCAARPPLVLLGAVPRFAAARARLGAVSRVAAAGAAVVAVAVAVTALAGADSRRIRPRPRPLPSRPDGCPR